MGFATATVVRVGARARTRSEALEALRRAVRDIAPVMIVITPFALVLGGTIAETEVPNAAGWAGAPLVFAGAAHLAAVTLIDSGATFAIVLLSVAIVNSRFLLYSASLATAFRGQPRWFRWLAPHFLVDQNYVLVANRIEAGDSPTAVRWYYLGATAAIAGTWLPVMALGVWLGPVIPESWPLRFTVPVLFIGMLLPGLRGHPAVSAAAAAFTVAILGSGLPHGLGLIAGTAVGVFVATTVEQRATRPKGARS